jgi:hypothetical protein
LQCDCYPRGLFAAGALSVTKILGAKRWRRLTERKVLNVVGWPHVVCGFSAGGQMNLTLAIAVYANICKVLRLPLSFLGKPGSIPHSTSRRTPRR